jgi:hypothetical protein
MMIALVPPGAAEMIELWMNRMSVPWALSWAPSVWAPQQVTRS